MRPALPASGLPDLACLFLLGGRPDLAIAAPACVRAPPAYPDHANLMVVRDASGQERPVKTPADWEVRRGHILAHLQEVMGPLPDRKRGSDRTTRS